MNLGEALSVRARLAQRLNDLKGRIKANAVAQEGDEPAENAAELMAAYLASSKELAALMVKITKTNASTVVLDKNLTDLLQDREELIRERNLYGSTADTATPNSDRYRYMRNEVKFVSFVDVADLRKKEEECNERVHILDAIIQKINWQTELV